MLSDARFGPTAVERRITDEALRRAIYSRQPRERLEAVIEECNQIVRPRSDPYYDFLAKRYRYFRQFAPAFVEALAFQSNQDDDPLTEAVEFLKALNRQGRRNVPDDAPMDFVPARWDRYVIGPDGRIVRRRRGVVRLMDLGYVTQLPYRFLKAPGDRQERFRLRHGAPQFE